jgi:hypothetical protein
VEWIKSHVHFDQPALEATLAEYLEEVDHVAARIVKLEKAIDEAVRQSPPEIRAVIEALQALLGVAQTTAATIKKIAWKAHQRLHKRYQALAVRDKNKNQIVTAVGRELPGSIWAIATEAEKQHKLAKSA